MVPFANQTFLYNSFHSLVDSPMPKMTFAIPCYNMEPWLPVCIESCLYQTEPNIEVLVVNDGSTDNSGAIADHYATQDHRIRVIHQTNQGHGKARQMAQDNASGEFILFLDADDFIDKNAVRDLLRRGQTGQRGRGLRQCRGLFGQYVQLTKIFLSSTGSQPDVRQPPVLETKGRLALDHPAGTCSSGMASGIRPTSPVRTTASCSKC